MKILLRTRDDALMCNPEVRAWLKRAERVLEDEAERMLEDLLVYGVTSIGDVRVYPRLMYWSGDGTGDFYPGPEDW